MRRAKAAWTLGVLAGACLLGETLASCGGRPHHRAAAGDPPETAVGERLFLETRFAQFFATHMVADAEHPAGNVNAPLAAGDPVLAQHETLSAPIDGAFAGQSMNCRQCHLVDEQLDALGGGMRSYAEFARRSTVPDRGDGQTHALRNSPSLVDATLGAALHFDGEFATIADLVRGTLAGRNFGWLPIEHAAAVAQVARVLREDDGSGTLAADTAGLSYRVLLAGVDASIPADLRLPPAYRLDVASATDAEIFDAVAALIGAYVEHLRFARNNKDRFNGSPYDAFLKRNHLPAAPADGETALAYGRRLRGALSALDSPRFVMPVAGTAFQFHPEHPDFAFQQAELDGLKIFLAEPALPALTQAQIDGGAGGVGNCLACHAPPEFTDHGLHNTGVSQFEFESRNGAGSFASLTIPDLATRSASAVVAAQVLPATVAHPAYEGRLRAIPQSADGTRADLGAWAVFANADFPSTQAVLRAQLCAIGPDCPADDASLLPRAVAAFKTPGLRDLGHSQPYLHSGAFNDLAAAVHFYVDASKQARAGALRAGDPRMAGVALQPADEAALAAFLAALDEDYN